MEFPKKDTQEWPEGVVERLQGYADANGVTLDDAKQKFVQFLSDKYAVENWQDEDEDFLIEASEGFVVQRRSGGSSFETVNFVGMLVGVDGKWRDKRKNLRDQAVAAYLEEPGKAVEAGLVAECWKEDGSWHLSKADGLHDTEEPEDEDPWFLWETGNGPIAILQTGDYDSKGDPVRPVLKSRYYYFLGNNEADFGTDVSIWRLDSSVIDATPTMWKPCRLKVIPNTREDVNPDFADILRVPRNWANEIVYTDDFVDTDVRAQLAPEKFGVNPAIHKHHVALPNLLEYYQRNMKEVPGINPVGPLAIVKGKVTSLFKEGWDNDYDETGKVYNLRLTSWDLQKEHPSGLRSEVSVRISGNLKENGHAFEYNDGADWKAYAERSTVLVFGRLGVRATDSGEVPQVNAFGVFAVPRFVVPAPEGGDSNAEQFE